MKVPNIDRKWLVFYTRSRSEKACEAQIRDKEIEVFLPKMEKIRQWKDRKKKVIFPLFPNYIFARVNEYERIMVLENQGIVNNLSFNGHFVEMSCEEITQIELMQHEPAALEVVRSPLPKLGQLITIKEGPMRGLKGEIMEHYGNTHLLVRVKALNQAVKVKVPVMMIEDGTMT